ncbi:MAG: carboxypeptidase-like regulatory domain-containing protein [Bacteroidota bacterium]
MSLPIKGQYLFLVCLLFLGHTVLAQKEKLLQGKIVSQNTDLQGVTIQVQSTKKGTITQEDGSFSIFVSIGDTLLFSAVQFKRKVVPVTELLFNSSSIVVEMEEFVNQLKEVIVQPYGLSGSLSEDIVRLPVQKDVNAQKLGLPNAGVRIISQSENKLNDADHGKYLYITPLGLGINVNKILNRLSGRTKILKNRVRLDAEYMAIQEMENKYMDSVLIAHLKIPLHRFHDFFYFCQMDEVFQQVKQNPDALMFMEYLSEKSKIYRKNNNLD